jgi:hypothetical protein
MHPRVVNDESRSMIPQPELRILIDNLEDAQKFLLTAAQSCSSLRPAGLALQRLARTASRPPRIALLGESNSGKSTIANLIAGRVTLPALPVANTRLPTLLVYAPLPYVEALYNNGERLALTSDSDVSHGDILRLEVGLPSESLRRIQILDFPGGANPFFQTDLLTVLRHRIDAAIWTTVATQAWRETERLAWLGIPPRIRRLGLLAITHGDLIGSEVDFRKLSARLELVAKEYFSAFCFVAQPNIEASPGAADDLFSKIDKLIKLFERERLEKALAMTHRIAARALDKLERGTAE